MGKRWVIDGLVVSKAVADEILAYEEDLTAWEAFFYSSRIRKLEEPAVIPPNRAGRDLGRGESEVISYAMAHSGYEVVLDDLEARRCAVTFNIPVRGTVGIILLAKKEHIIPAAKPLIESLKSAGLRFNEDWIISALSLAGEA